MYIPEFWCGVAATIIAEIAFCIIIGVVLAVKEKKDAKKEGEANEPD